MVVIGQIHVLATLLLQVYPKCILLINVFYLLNLLALSKIQLCKLHNNESNETTMKCETTRKWQELDVAFVEVISQHRSHKSLNHDTKYLLNTNMMHYHCNSNITGVMSCPSLSIRNSLQKREFSLNSVLEMHLTN